jgi:hypothetical protein
MRPSFHPFRVMDAKTRVLSLLAALSLSCAGVAWAWDHGLFATLFLVLNLVALFGAAEGHWG